VGRGNSKTHSTALAPVTANIFKESPELVSINKDRKEVESPEKD
jgi:hypothetical protein